jgi:chemotaxis protein CheX
MDVRYINPFVSAVQHVFKTMLDLGIFVSRPTIRGRDRRASAVSAIIELSGPVTGTVALCFSKQAAVRVASVFSGKALSIHQPAELADALGELANMVAGQAKSELPPSGITISLPRVVLVDQNRERAPALSPTLVLPCDSALGRFSVEVTMATNRSSPYAVEHAQEPAYKQPSA